MSSSSTEMINDNRLSIGRNLGLHPYLEAMLGLTLEAFMTPMLEEVQCTRPRP